MATTINMQFVQVDEQDMNMDSFIKDAKSYKGIHFVGDAAAKAVQTATDFTATVAGKAEVLAVPATEAAIAFCLMTVKLNKLGDSLTERAGKHLAWKVFNRK